MAKPAAMTSTAGVNLPPASGPRNLALIPGAPGYQNFTSSPSSGVRSEQCPPWTGANNTPLGPPVPIMPGAQSKTTVVFSTPKCYICLEPVTGTRFSHREPRDCPLEKFFSEGENYKLRPSKEQIELDRKRARCTFCHKKHEPKWRKNSRFYCIDFQKLRERAGLPPMVDTRTGFAFPVYQTQTLLAQQRETEGQGTVAAASAGAVTSALAEAAASVGVDRLPPATPTPRNTSGGIKRPLQSPMEDGTPLSKRGSGATATSYAGAAASQAAPSARSAPDREQGKRGIDVGVVTLDAQKDVDPEYFITTICSGVDDRNLKLEGRNVDIVRTLAEGRRTGPKFVGWWIEREEDIKTMAQWVTDITGGRFKLLPVDEIRRL